MADNVTSSAGQTYALNRAGGWLSLFVVVLVATVIWCLVDTQRAAWPVEVTQADVIAAHRQYVELFGIAPDREDTLATVGERAVQDKNWEQALACFRAVPTEHLRFGVSARLQEAQLLVRLNRASEAERVFETYLSLPKRKANSVAEAAAYKWLNFILSAELRFEERKQLLRKVHQLGLADVLDSKQLYFPNLLIWNAPLGRKRCQDFLQVDPSNRDLQVASCRYLTAEGKLDESRDKLRVLAAVHSGDQRVLAALLENAFERNDWIEMSAIEKQLPPTYSPTDPWLLTRLRGELALHRQEWNTAVDHFAQVIREDPANSWSHVGLARAYGALKRMDEQAHEQRKSAALAKIRVHVVKVTDRDENAALALADLCDDADLSEAANVFRAHVAQMRSTSEKRSPSDLLEVP